MTDRNVEELLHHMPAVHRRAETGWAKGFTDSIIKQARRRNWRPSPKQIGIMRWLVSELFAEVEDLDLIERFEP